MKNQLDKLIRDPKIIEGMLPQRPPFVMVDRLIYVDEHTAITGFTPTENTIFADRGFFTESGIIEHMAQSIALKSGYHARQKRQEKTDSFGVLAALKNVQFFQPPRLGHALETHVKTLQEFGGMQAADLEVYEAESAIKIARGTLKTFKASKV